MAERPIILGIVGDSAAGKTTLTRGIAQVLGEHDVTTICTDDYHRYDRKQRKEMGISALHPDCNYVDIIEQHLELLRQGRPILKPIYNHTTGEFDAPEYIEPKKFVIVEGLLGYSSKIARDAYDVKVYLAPPEDLRTKWKIKRDTRKRGYDEAAVLAALAAREPDSEAFIRPQRKWADVIVTFYPPDAPEEQANDLLLNVNLVLRPTIPHPDFTDILDSDLGKAIRLGLERDMGKPVDVLSIDGHATPDQVQQLERILCSDVPYLGQFCSLEGNQEVGKIVGTTGETLQSYPLALTQLLITYHMLMAMGTAGKMKVAA
ncbi:phosphoribulokinase [Leptolyngbyaceae cyanobacterium CCMR0082]|uniref:phosphoribulokinase n=2 Tax=Adonisia turfae TaxID=2950184 RepID=A0A6M0SB79_9CYAN|nr:phosphoribulokinase [Adonisia turfae]MDV3348467.1 phosphoribulokinase [Leptothoe sp. LEGE 181152]NEZ56493.1 phosphoribulokinase [Adonisia turfae CCMR0081]NEZ65724.1 phosphoribulokinase [Adonisia turfae CCMR0082]